MANKPQKPRKTMSDLWDEEVNRIDRMKRKAIEDGYIINAPVGEKPEKVTKSDLQRLRSITEQSVTKLKFANRNQFSDTATEKYKTINYDFSGILENVESLESYINKYKANIGMSDDEAYYYAKLKRISDTIEEAEKRGFEFDKTFKTKINEMSKSGITTDNYDFIEGLGVKDLFMYSIAADPYTEKTESGTLVREREKYASRKGVSPDKAPYVTEIIQERLSEAFENAGIVGGLINEEIAAAVEKDGIEAVYQRMWQAGDRFLNMLDKVITYQEKNAYVNLEGMTEFAIEVIRGDRRVLKERTGKAVSFRRKNPQNGERDIELVAKIYETIYNTNTLYRKIADEISKVRSGEDLEGYDD